MSDLTNIDKRKFELLLNMGGGYVLNFSDRTFNDFFLDSINFDINSHYNGSKANRLRAFWRQDANNIVGKLMGDMLEYGVDGNLFDGKEELLEKCRGIVARLMQNGPIEKAQSEQRSQRRMFNVLIHGDRTAWETDQLMRIDARRFNKEYSGSEAKNITAQDLESLKLLEGIDTLLMYESGREDASLVRYGHLHEIRVAGMDMVFRFEEKGKFPRSVIEEFWTRLGMAPYEENRTHWAIKDGGIPTAMLAKLMPSYHVVFSFAGENREYVRQVADYLRPKGVNIFYDEYEQPHLWGKDLAEHFDLIYSRSGQYCVMFISKDYVKKMWTRHERRAALSRALTEQREYILPARFDDTDVPGILPTVGYISLSHTSPTKFGNIILKKLGKDAPNDVEDSPNELAFLRCEVKPVHFNFPTHPAPSFEIAECAYVIFGNPPVGKKGKMIRSIAAQITYADFTGKMFTSAGRWADTDQPSVLDPRQSTTHLLRVDFNVGDEHHLDIAANFKEGCFAVNNDSLRGQVKDPAKKLTGPIVKISVQLVAEGVNQHFDFQLRIGSRFELLPIGLT
jgi:TIR domain